jgi:four helix bundle protein
MESGILSLEKEKNIYASDFTDLKVFRFAFDISVVIHKRSLEFPKIEQYALADQLRRCTKSVCANLVEGYSKQSYSRAEFKRFIAMALGSCGESRMWLLYCRELNYIMASEFTEWNAVYVKVANMLRRLHSNIK